ncbi:MAG TPA: class I SAM-dependent methyltransferase [Acidimicrobiales bacterium]|nr:class I SAM-dependent methyltransferase [Acidimicrobiales bacterium]
METAAVARQVDETSWYHSIEVAPGLVTPGWFDHRAVVDRIPWPELTGRRCLDVGTFDGFWAFTMERRGAGEVVAVDVAEPSEWDWPADTAPGAVEAIGSRRSRGDGFLVARGALGSSVTRLDLNVYDLDPAEVGRFDVVFVGSLLLHLRDPVRALERVRAVCGGRLVLMDAVDLGLSLSRRPVARLDGRGRPWWWKPNRAALRRMVEAAGFRVVSGPAPLRVPAGADQRRSWRPSARALTSSEGREALGRVLWGDPHAVVTAEPSVG